MNNIQVTEEVVVPGVEVLRCPHCMAIVVVTTADVIHVGFRCVEYEKADAEEFIDAAQKFTGTVN